MGDEIDFTSCGVQYKLLATHACTVAREAGNIMEKLADGTLVLQGDIWVVRHDLSEHNKQIFPIALNPGDQLNISGAGISFVCAQRRRFVSLIDVWCFLEHAQGIPEIGLFVEC